MTMMVSEEGDHGEIRKGPVVTKVDSEIDGSGKRHGDGLKFAEFADYGGVLKRLTGIFTRGWAGAQTFFGDCHVEIERRAGERGGGGIDAQLEGAFVRIGTRKRGEEQVGNGMSGSGADLLTRIGTAAAYELSTSVDNHLRRIDATPRESVGVVVLTNGEIVGRIRIAPAEMVPVVDMFFEGDDLDAVEGLLVAELFEEQIGGRTAGAAFRGEEFDDHGLPQRDIVRSPGDEGPAGGDE